MCQYTKDGAVVFTYSLVSSVLREIDRMQMEGREESTLLYRK